MNSGDQLISIIMPVFNTAVYLEQAVSSILNQTYPHWELLVVDDGSVDDSWSILQKLSAKDNRIRIFHQKNSGVSAARNAGLKHVCGDFLCLLDSDDWLPPQSLELRLKKFSESKRIYFVDGYVEIFSGHSHTSQRIWRPVFTGRPLQKLLRLSDQCFFGPTWMIRWPQQGFIFDEEIKHGEDLLFYITLADLGDYAFVKETTYCYRNRHDSAMKNIEGLDDGYSKLKCKLSALNKFGPLDKLVFSVKTKKIMFFSFLNAGKPGHAFRALMR